MLNCNYIRLLHTKMQVYHGLLWVRPAFLCIPNLFACIAYLIGESYQPHRFYIFVKSIESMIQQYIGEIKQCILYKEERLL